MEKKYIKPEVEVVDLTNSILAGSDGSIQLISTDGDKEANVQGGVVQGMESKQGGWGWSDED